MLERHCQIAGCKFLASRRDSPLVEGLGTLGVVGEDEISKIIRSIKFVPGGNGLFIELFYVFKNAPLLFAKISKRARSSYLIPGGNSKLVKGHRLKDVNVLDGLSKTISGSIVARNNSLFILNLGTYVKPLLCQPYDLLLATSYFRAIPERS